MSFNLTKQQRNFFELFGYIKLPGLFADQATELQSAFDQLYQQHAPIVWNHEAHYNKPRYMIGNFAERHSVLRQLITDPALQAAFSGLLGADYSYTASEGNIFTSDTYWHSDLYGCHFKYLYVKALFYLDPLTERTGALCVIPGSHRFGDKYANFLQARLWEHEKHFGITKEEVPYTAIETAPGDVILFDYRIKHATFNHSDSPRRMFTICASQRFAAEDEDKLLKSQQDLLSMGMEVHTAEFLASLSEAERYRIEQTLSLLDRSTADSLNQENAANPSHSN